MNQEKIYLNVTVSPRSRKRSVEKIGNGEYKVRVLSPPSKGEANKEVVSVIASFFGIPPSLVTIVKGHSSRHKRILIESK